MPCRNVAAGAHYGAGGNEVLAVEVVDVKNGAGNEIVCPHCGLKGEAIYEGKRGQVRKICPQCGNVVTFRRKKK